MYPGSVAAKIQAFLDMFDFFLEVSTYTEVLGLEETDMTILT